MTACAVVVFNKPTEAALDAVVVAALSEVGMLGGGASEFHGVLSFDGVIMTENGSGERIILLFFSLLLGFHVADQIIQSCAHFAASVRVDPDVAFGGGFAFVHVDTLTKTAPKPQDFFSLFMHFVCKSLVFNELWRRAYAGVITRLVSVTYRDGEKNLSIFYFWQKKKNPAVSGEAFC